MGDTTASRGLDAENPAAMQKALFARLGWMATVGRCTPSVCRTPSPLCRPKQEADAGDRALRGRKGRGLLETARSEQSDLERQAQSEVRTAREAVAATGRALESARAAAEQANEVLRITDVAFREGATTNIEVLDAQPRVRDAETAAAIAEDALRRARLDLLVALGRFPR